MPSQAEQDEMIKRRERQARVARVPNLASRMAPAPAGAPQQNPNAWSGGAPAPAPPPPASSSPWGAPAPQQPVNVPQKMTQQQHDLMMKQRERDARATSRVVPNLANMMNEGGPAAPGPAVVAGQTSSPWNNSNAPGGANAPVAVPQKMTRQEEELMIKQRERAARGVTTASRTAKVPNLANAVNDGQRTAQPAAAASPWSSTSSQPRPSGNVPKKMTRQEEELMIKQRERAARGMAASGGASVVPNLAAAVNDAPAAANPWGNSGAQPPSGSVPKKMTRQEEELMIKQRERASRGVASSAARASHVPNLAAAVNDAPKSNPWGSSTSQPPAAAVPKKMTKQEEDLMIKQRERASRGMATSTGHSSVVPNLAQAVGGSMTDAKNGVVVPDNSDLVVASVDVSTGQQRIEQGRQDAIAKARGRRPRASRNAQSHSSAASTSSSVSSGTSASVAPTDVPSSSEPDIAPGALAVQTGAAVQRQKWVLTAQPKQDSLRELQVVEEGEINEEPELEKKEVTPPEPEVEEPVPVPTPEPRPRAPLEAPAASGVESYAVEEAYQADQVVVEEEKEKPSRRWMIHAGLALVIIAIASAISAALAGKGEPETAPPPPPPPPTAAPTFAFSERFVSIKAELAGTVSSESSLEDYFSPQFKALQWVADEDNSSLQNLEKLKARYVLAVLYFSMGGKSWSNPEWLDKETTECAWERIQCDFTESVTDFTEETNVNMRGYLPSELNFLSKLETITIKNNLLAGLAGPLESVESLALDKNSIEGNFPSAIYSMTNLAFLSLSENSLSGEISTEIGNLVNLERLDVSNNGFSGTITNHFQPLTKLVELKISDNNFEGVLGDVTTGLTDLRALFAQRNSFSGTVPPELAELTNLARFEVGSNSLTGSFPNFFWTIANMGSLDLDYNDFTGTLSTEIGLAIELELLNLKSIGLSGTIPTEVGLLPKIRQFTVPFNDFTGTIPTEIGNLDKLVTLSLQANQLTGTIPTELGDLNKLLYLKLDSNYLNGTVPIELEELTNLYELTLAFNEELGGDIPQGMCDFDRLIAVQIGFTNIVCDCDKCA